MNTFNHLTHAGICQYIELPSINTDVDAIGLACGFTAGIINETVGFYGEANLHPKDKHYIKSIGRQVALDKKQQVFFKILEIYKYNNQYATIVLVGKIQNKSVHLKLRVQRGKRVQIEIQ